MRVCLKVPPSKNLHRTKASQLTLIECQMSGLYITQGITERSLRTDLKVTVMQIEKALKNDGLRVSKVS